MYKLSLLQKKRVWWARLAKALAWCSIFFLFSWIWLRAYFPPNIEYPANMVALILFFSSSLVVRIPFTKYKESGTITLGDEDFLVEILSKKDKYKISDLSEVRVAIQGYWGQEFPSVRNLIPLEDGTSNFISFKYREQKRKLEVLLECKEDLATFKQYVRKYQSQVNIKLTERAHVN